MHRLLPLSLCLLLPMTAWADDAPAALDLGLPQSPPAWSQYSGDPPGTYYGDTSGVPVAQADGTPLPRSACPTAPDGSETDLTGDVTVGMGHSRLGTSRYGAVGLNYCKSYTDADGDARTINVRIDVGESDGPMYYGPMHDGPVYDGPFHGGSMYGAPGDGPYMGPVRGSAGRGGPRGRGF